MIWKEKNVHGNIIAVIRPMQGNVNRIKIDKQYCK